ncbi:hypothetical protein GALL_121710 [mine drainage metagenome]|uniref:X-Pro dipeptidyl-peptidase n=1 Tax=mine drainage metagenome TaxID=410659 RepID=A0A1J5SNW6_9ZZZZ
MRKTIFVLLLLISFQSQAQKAFDTYYQTSEVQPLLVNYDADKGSLTRFYTITNSPERRERFKKFNQEYLQKLEQLDFDKMKTSSQVDYILFQRTLKNELFLLDKEEKEFTQIEKYIPFADSIYQWEKLRRRGAYLNSESIAHQLFSIDKQIQSLSKSVAQQGLIDDNLSKRAEQTVKGLQDALKSVYDFYFGYDPKFSWWIQKPYQQTDSALNKYAALLKSKANKSSSQKEDASGIVGHPIGREELLRQLQYEFIPYSPEELVEIANKEFAWCDAEMLKASRELGFGDNWKAALEKVKNSYVPEGHQPEMIMDLYNQSVDFIKKHDLVTIPPLAEETWRMTMMSPKQQLVSPFFLGGEELMISYPTNTMDEDAKLMSMRGNNPHFSRATVHHELIAGHCLEFYMNERYKPYRNYFTPFWIEGWSLYWEFILWDMNFPRNAEDRIGMLFWRMHRCARIIFSLNYHLGNWTPQQCIDFLVDRVGHERANAEGEVRRSFTGGYGPLYQLAYMTGALQFYAMKKELVDTKKMTYKQFNDAILKENCMPIELVRAILTNQKLTRDFKTSWRFYNK